MAEPKKKLGILLGFGPKPKSEEGSLESPKTLAARGMFDALKADDFSGFEEALSTYIDASNAPMGEAPDAVDAPEIEDTV